VLSVIISACSTLTSLREDLDDAVIAYNDLLRRGEFNRAKIAKNVKIVDYHIVNADFEAARGEQIVEVEFEYYISPVYMVKTLIDKQKWSYVSIEKEKKKRWRLITTLPEFK
jgi:hypothetical protein